MYESGENYLETILILKNRLGAVRSIDIATELNYSKPSVSRAVGLLKEAGYITVEESGHIVLTETGEKEANRIYDRHRTITQFFKDTLQLDDQVAEDDACKIEHIISEETFSAIKKYVQQS